MCRVCGNAEHNRTLTVREMMYGTRERFDYIRCARCGCVQIADVPADLARFYPGDYYSFAPAPQSGALLTYLQCRRARHVLGKKNILGWMLTRLRGVPATLEYVRRAGVSFDDAVLEVGCGNGERLMAMRDYGFTDLTGLDPYAGEAVGLTPGVRIVRAEISAHEGSYDFITLHHSFEHMDEPGEVMGHLSRLLRPGGKALLRVPLASSRAFQTYGTDWVQLDAPRHLYLHTPESIAILTSRGGLAVTETVYDSTAFQFWGSEQYRRDIPLRDERSYAVNRRASVFSKDEIKRFEVRARRLNREGSGDQACFYLEKSVR